VRTHTHIHTPAWVSFFCNFDVSNKSRDDGFLVIHVHRTDAPLSCLALGALLCVCERERVCVCERESVCK
jgi:hypothetical protein